MPGLLVDVNGRSDGWSVDGFFQLFSYLALVSLCTEGFFVLLECAVLCSAPGSAPASIKIDGCSGAIPSFSPPKRKNRSHRPSAPPVGPQGTPREAQQRNEKMHIIICIFGPPPRSPKRHQRGPQEAPSGPQEAPKRRISDCISGSPEKHPRDAVRDAPQAAPKMAPRPPQDRPGGPQDGPKSLPRGPMRHQEAPMWPPCGPHAAPPRPQKSSRDPRLDFSTLLYS